MTTPLAEPGARPPDAPQAPPDGRGNNGRAGAVGGPPTSDRSAARRTATRALSMLGEAAGVGVLAGAIASLLYRVWDATWSVALQANISDTQQITAMVQGIQEHGWYLNNPSLGAPFGQQYYDFPHAGETLQLLGIKALTKLIGSPGAVVNTYFLLGFVVLAAVTHLVLRHLRFRFLVAAPLALLYTFLPYHFWHGEEHLYRSAYVSAPLACLVLLWVLSWRTTFLHDPDGPLRGRHALRANLRWGWVAAAGALCVVIPLTETMTIAFMLVALAAGCIVVAIRDRDPGTMVAGVLVGAVVVGVFLIAMIPNFSYWAKHGTNDDAARRTPAEQEMYGLQVSQMLLPVPNHRLHVVRGVQKAARKGSPIHGEGGQELGVIGAIGFLALVYGALAHGLRRRDRRPFHDRRTLWAHSSLLSVLLVLVGVVSGGALLLSIAGLSQVRTWNRVIVLIAFFAFVVVGIGFERGLDRVGRWWSGRGGRRLGRQVLSVGLAAALVAFGLWDTAVTPRQHYDQNARRAAEVSAFTQQLERRLPRGAALFQLPTVPFPENPPVAWMVDYAELRPYLASGDYFRWSYGGMKGRPEADWQQQIAALTPATLTGLEGLGFAGIVVDTRGYDDLGISVTAALTAMLGPAQVASSSGRWVYWPLAGYGHSHGADAAKLRHDAEALVGPQLIKDVPPPR